MSTLIHTINSIAYDDTNSSNNPLLRHWYWQRTNTGVTVSNPISDKHTIQPNTSQVVFSGTRTTAIDGTSVFSISLNPVNSSTYRISHTSGTAPAFRTDRALTLSGANITVVVNNNATATFTTSTGNFNAVQIGDTVFVPHTTTGDSASPFSVLNVGYWVVLARTTTVITVTRPSTQGFEGTSEIVALSANNQLQAFSSNNVQVGDTLDISAGFSTVTQKNYTISAVNPFWVEFTSTESLPLETGIQPTASGLTFYGSSKRFLRIEADQGCVIRLNGDTGNTNRIDPMIVGDAGAVGWFEKWGPVWSLEIVNRSKTSVLTIKILTAE
jgi:hypothetical protein